MAVYQVQLLEPKALALLESLAGLNLIQFKKFEPSMQVFWDWSNAKVEEAVISGKDPGFSRSTPKKEKPRPKFGSAKGMFVMATNFDEPLEDFKEYME